MGGTIAVTVREPDGTEHRMARWTNATPWFINHIGLVNKDPQHLKEFMDSWEKMRQDWLEHLKVCKKKNHTKCSFEHNMTTCYAPYTSLAPDGYGLLVVDMKKEVILSCQGYTKYGETFLSSSTSSDEWEVIEELLKAGRIKNIATFCGKKLKISKDVVSLKKSVKGDIYIAELDLSPFKIIRVPEDDYRALKKEVLKLGFKLSKEEEKLWKEEIKMAEED